MQQALNLNGNSGEFVVGATTSPLTDVEFTDFRDGVRELELWSRLMNANNEFSKAVMNLVSGWFNNIGYYLKKKITIDY